MPKTPTRYFGLRARAEDVERFYLFREELQAKMPYGQVSMADALAIAVNSASTALAKGELQVTFSKAEAALPDLPKDRAA